jgi:hypothetical protein
MVDCSRRSKAETFKASKIFRDREESQSSGRRETTTLRSTAECGFWVVESYVQAHRIACKRRGSGHRENEGEDSEKDGGKRSDLDHQI